MNPGWYPYWMQPPRPQVGKHECENTPGVVAYYYTLESPWNRVPTVSVETTLDPKTLLSASQFSFSGEKKDWFAFANDFMSTVHNVKYHVIVKYRCLRSILSRTSESTKNSEVKAFLSRLLNVTGEPFSQYREYLKGLQTYYGHTSIYVEELTRQLKSNKKARPGSIEDIMNFYTDLNNYITCLHWHFGNFPDSKVMEPVFTEVYNSMHPTLQAKYGTFCSSFSPPIVADMYSLRTWLIAEQQLLQDTHSRPKNSDRPISTSNNDNRGGKAFGARLRRSKRSGRTYVVLGENDEEVEEVENSEEEDGEASSTSETKSNDEQMLEQLRCFFASKSGQKNQSSKNPKKVAQANVVSTSNSSTEASGDSASAIKVVEKASDVFKVTLPKRKGFKPNSTFKVCPCPSSSNQHQRLHKCPSFKRLDEMARNTFIMENGRCMSCLVYGHYGSDCKNKGKCSKCNSSKHHTMLHNSRMKEVMCAIIENEILTEDASTQEAGENVAQDERTPEHFETDNSGYLCIALSQPPTKTKSSSAKTKDNSTQSSCVNSKMSALMMGPVLLNGKRANYLADSGASVTIVSEEMVKMLGVQGKPSEWTLSGVGNKKIVSAIEVKLTLESFDRSRAYKIKAKVLPRLCGSLRPINWNKVKLEFPYLHGVQFPEALYDEPIDILLGSDLHILHESLKEIPSRGPNTPYARKTRIGWTAAGGLPDNYGKEYEALTQYSFHQIEEEGASYAEKIKFAQAESPLFFTTEDPKLLEKAAERDVDLCAAHCPVHGDTDTCDVLALMKRIADIDRIPSDDFEKKALSEDDKKALAILAEAKKMGKQYGSRCLWNPDLDRSQLKNNYFYALQRLKNVERSKHYRNEDVRKGFIDEVDSWQEEEYTEAVEDEKPHLGKGKFYLPIFPIVRFDKETSQVRPVVDAKARHAGHSLNDFILSGPNLINDIVAVLFRFRLYPIALAGDVSRFFLRTYMYSVSDRDFHRFLWRMKNGEIGIRRFKVHAFGNKGSPCVAMYLARKMADEVGSERAKETVYRSTIVDDNLDSVETIKEAIELRKQLTKIYAHGNMKIKKWQSNEDAVLADLPDEEKGKHLDISGVAADLMEEDQLLTKTLGIVWSPSHDCFTFAFAPPEDLSSLTWTKRLIASTFSRIYDPLGMLAPVIILAKIIMQETWQLNIDWDTPIPELLLRRWKKWLSTLPEINKIRIPRALKFPGAKYIEIHAFSDATLEAYAAVIYVVSYHDEEKKYCSRQAVAKARVASGGRKPSNTVPRLELQGMYLAMKILSNILGEVPSVQQKDIFLWTDSMNCLWWTKHSSDKALLMFVANRVAYITEKVFPSNIRHVATDLNPADVFSRGCTPAELANDELTLKGPQFLESRNFPVQPAFEKNHIKNAEEEMKKVARNIRGSEAVFYVRISELRRCEQLKDEYPSYPTVEERDHPTHIGSWTTFFNVRRCALLWKHKAFNTVPCYKFLSPPKRRDDPETDDDVDSVVSGGEEMEEGNDVDDAEPREEDKENDTQAKPGNAFAVTSKLYDLGDRDVEEDAIVPPTEKQEEKDARAFVEEFRSMLKHSRGPTKAKNSLLRLDEAPASDLVFAKAKGGKLGLPIDSEETPRTILDSRIWAEAWASIWRQTQEETFHRTRAELKRFGAVLLSNNLAPLRPKLYEDGIMRAETRTRQSKYLPFGTRCPIIVHPQHPVTKLYFRHVHEKPLLHTGGPGQLLNTVRKSLWVPRGRNLAHKVICECASCRRMLATQRQQHMAALPDFRIPRLSSVAFEHTSVDGFGPLYAKFKKGTRSDSGVRKRYGILFTCLASRAVHIEMAEDNGTDAFFRAFDRFLARRPRPRLMRSDGGGNFRAAKRLITAIREAEEASMLPQRYHDIRWELNTPYAPHTGGAHERCVALAKTSMYAQLKGVTPTDDELHTVLTRAEGILNNRPLTFVSGDLDDPLPVTPNHLLAGMGSTVAQVLPSDEGFVPGFIRTRQLVEKCWKQLIDDLVPKLATTKRKFLKAYDDLREGDVVIALDAKKLGRWPLARIVQMRRGKDGLVRTVIVRQANELGKPTHYERPFNYVAPLPRVNPEDEDEVKRLVKRFNTTLPSEERLAVARHRRDQEPLPEVAFPAEDPLAQVNEKNLSTAIRATKKGGNEAPPLTLQKDTSSASLAASMAKNSKLSAAEEKFHASKVASDEKTFPRPIQAEKVEKKISHLGDRSKVLSKISDEKTLTEEAAPVAVESEAPPSSRAAKSERSPEKKPSRPIKIDSVPHSRADQTEREKSGQEDATNHVAPEGLKTSDPDAKNILEERSQAAQGPRNFSQA